MEGLIFGILEYTVSADGEPIYIPTGKGNLSAPSRTQTVQSHS